MSARAAAYAVFEHHDSAHPAGRAVNHALMVLILANVAAVIAGSFQDLYQAGRPWFDAFEAVSVTVFTVEFLVRLWAAPDRWRHLRSWPAWVDLLAVLPFYLPLLLPVDLRVLRVLRVLRLVRVFKLGRYIESFDLIRRVLNREKNALGAALFLLAVLLVLASCLMYALEHTAQPGAFPNAVAAMWWAITTLTTVGYGDVVPITAEGRLLSGAVSLLGIAFVALPTAIISSGFLAEWGRKDGGPDRPASTDRVKAYYDRDPDREWDRLSRHPLEFPVTMSFLQRHLPAAPSRIIDVGAGPGRYSLALAALGHRVSLVDLSPANVEAARSRAADRNLPLEGCEVGDARDLGRWPAASFDAALLMGPLYHLSDEADRRRAVAQIRRLLVPGGMAVFSFISRYAAAFDALKHLPDEVRLTGAQALAMVDHRTNASNPDDPGFTDAWFADPAECGPWIAAQGFSPVAVFGAEGPLAQSDHRLGPAGQPLFQDWLAFALATAESPAGLFGSEHVVVIARKTREVS